MILLYNSNTLEMCLQTSM